MTEPSLADLREFGSPIYVPSTSPWRVAGVEHSNGIADGVVVVGDDGDLELRTESAARARQPLSIRVQNVQLASAPQPSAISTRTAQIAAAWGIIVTDAEHPVVVDGVERHVVVLKSSTRFSFELQVKDLVVRGAGALAELTSLRIVRCDDSALSG